MPESAMARMLYAIPRKIKASFARKRKARAVGKAAQIKTLKKSQDRFMGM